MLIEKILDRVKKYLGVDRYAEVARQLGVSPQTLNGWRKRGTIPWQELYVFATQQQISMDWLFNGESYVSAEIQDQETRKAIQAVKEIMESKEAIIISALQTNLLAFQTAIKSSKENCGLRQDVTALQRRLDHLEHVNDPRATDVV